MNPRYFYLDLNNGMKAFEYRLQSYIIKNFESKVPICLLYLELDLFHTKNVIKVRPMLLHA